MITQKEIEAIKIGDTILVQYLGGLHRGRVVSIRIWISKLGNKFRFFTVEYHGRNVEVPYEMVLDI